MRFDDSLETVLAADMTTAFGAQSTWRQLVDLIGRGRAAASPAAIAQLRLIRVQVPPPVRAASARALADANPPAALVRFFAEDDIVIAAPILRTAMIDDAAWITMLPEISPAARSILRHRRDLSPEVTRALQSFGSVDFVLSTVVVEVTTADIVALRDVPPESAASEQEAATEVLPDPDVTAPESTFVSLGSVARALPLVAEALRQGDDNDAETAPSQADPADPSAGTFRIAEIVARIEAYHRRRDKAPAFKQMPGGAEVQPELFALDHVPALAFRFETDATGIVRWVEGATRAALIGISLDLAALPSGSRVDGAAAGAFRKRASFTGARLVVEGSSDAAGQWRINGTPVFDRASGRFTGYRGTARRPRADESAEPVRTTGGPGSDALRQLVHELRTPANAIAGFAEMIETQMLGPVPAPYRTHAAAIRNQTSDLLGAIDDIDMAARIESDALDLRPGTVPLALLLARISSDLAPLVQLRGAALSVDAGADDLAIAGDDRAVERLVTRLLATLVSSAAEGERIAVSATTEGERTIALAIDRPVSLGAYPEECLFTIDAEAEAERDGAPLLGTGFALRLARNLAIELGGTLTIGDKSLTLRLPAALLQPVEQASSS